MALSCFPAVPAGESSFWFGSLKLLLIIVFIIIGIGMVTGLVGSDTVVLSNYTNDGGLFPRGMGIIMDTIITRKNAMRK